MRSFGPKVRFSIRDKSPVIPHEDKVDFCDMYPNGQVDELRAVYDQIGSAITHESACQLAPAETPGHFSKIAGVSAAKGSRASPT
ncbi:hypothetical protein ROS217_09395 [Roseovarius sp. 217]|nr:hypothetical protein ROS217_09395 [Roseovarius sp. 217]